VLEGVRRVAEGPGVARVEGVLNATTGAVLAAVERGASPSAALKRARERGLAEADPSRDLEGRDAADKLAVIARVAWGVSLNADAIPRETIDLADCLGRPGRPLRQVGVVERDGNGVRARVELRRLKSGDPLLSDEDAGVVALVTGADGAVTRVAGSGAGRWPTAESVVADVLDEWRARSSPGSAGRSEAVRGSRETGVSPAGV
jgi:homoserine dehydrogenase